MNSIELLAGRIGVTPDVLEMLRRRAGDRMFGVETHELEWLHSSWVTDIEPDNDLLTHLDTAGIEYNYIVEESERFVNQPHLVRFRRDVSSPTYAYGGGCYSPFATAKALYIPEGLILNTDKTPEELTMRINWTNTCNHSQKPEWYELAMAIIEEAHYDTYMPNIKFVSGDILQSHCEVLVNPVNIQGTMGKGLAESFKIRYPDTFKHYRGICKKGGLHMGQFLVSKEGDKHIVCLPTKNHWRDSSRIGWIEQSVKRLVEWVRDNNIESVALPALGCGEGGIDWQEMRDLLIRNLRETKCVWTIYEPYM